MLIDFKLQINYMLVKRGVRVTYLLSIFLFLCVPCYAHIVQEADYAFKSASIDVVIPCSGKDLLTLELCIDGIKKYGRKVRRIIVVSDQRYTDKAEWFDEKNYAFTRLDLAQAIFDTPTKAVNFVQDSARINWIYQQFLKLYAPFTIDDLSPNVLLLDADTVFLRPVHFLKEGKYGLFAVGKEHHKPYFAHMKRVLPWLKRVHQEYSGISHHMLIQKPVLEDLIDAVQKEHRMIAWKALCKAIDVQDLQGSCMSEYEIYFNFALMRTKKLKVRALKWKNVSTLAEIDVARLEGYHFVSCHTSLR